MRSYFRLGGDLFHRERVTKIVCKNAMVGRRSVLTISHHNDVAFPVYGGFPALQWPLFRVKYSADPIEYDLYFSSDEDRDAVYYRLLAICPNVHNTTLEELDAISEACMATGEDELVDTDEVRQLYKLDE